MLALSEVFGIYFLLALAAVYGIWRLIGHQGFVGLEDTDSRLAKHFRKSAAPIPDPKRATSRA